MNYNGNIYPGIGGYYNPMSQSAVPQMQQAPQDERIWVQNQTSAEAYLVAPNGFVRLWDSSAPVFYEKRADATGRPYPLDIYEYSRKKPQNPILDNDSTNGLRDEIEALKARLSALEGIKEGAKKNAKQSNANDADA